jgi:dTDP-glucose 4,6-dehydratase
MTKKKIETVIVTGGLGFIGSRFIKHVLETTDMNVINIDSETYAADHTRIPYGHCDEKYMFHKADICDISKPCFYSEMLQDAEYLVNFAAETHVDNSISDGGPFAKTNVMGVLALLEFFRKGKNRKKFVQISTDEVYGDMADLRGKQRADEGFSLKPSSYYSATKASADLLVMSAARTYGVPYIITRSCNNFGPNQNPEKFLPKIFEAAKNGDTVPVYGDGKQSREWIHTDDNVAQICSLMRSEATNRIYNIGSGYHYKNIEIVRFLQRYFPLKFEFVDDRLGHDKIYSLDCTKIKRFLGDKVYYPLEGFLKSEIELAKKQ